MYEMKEAALMNNSSERVHFTLRYNPGQRNNVEHCGSVGFNVLPMFEQGLALMLKA